MRNSVFFQISRNGLLISFDVFSVPHRETERERELPQKQSVGLIIPESLMYATAVLQRKSIQDNPLPPSPPTPPPTPPPGLIDVSDGEAGIPALLYF